MKIDTGYSVPDGEPHLIIVLFKDEPKSLLNDLEYLQTLGGISTNGIKVLDALKEWEGNK